MLALPAASKNLGASLLAAEAMVFVILLKLLCICLFESTDIYISHPFSERLQENKHSIGHIGFFESLSWKSKSVILQ